MTASILLPNESVTRERIRQLRERLIKRCSAPRRVDLPSPPGGEGTEGDEPTNVLMRRIVDAFAEYERLIIAARTRAALQAKIRRGHRCGKVRFGYDLAADGKTLVKNDIEQGCWS